MSSPRKGQVQLAPLPEGRDVRLLLAGVWDLFHYGHAKAMKNAKLLFPNVTLIIGSTPHPFLGLSGCYNLLLISGTEFIAPNTTQKLTAANFFFHLALFALQSTEMTLLHSSKVK